MVHPGGLLALRLALRAVAKATLSSLVLAVSTATSSIPSSLKITENMVHPGGFEPPTARFVAEYSIQLSYGCIGKLALLRVSVTTNTCHTEYDGVIGRVTRLRLALRAAAFTAFFFLFTERRWCIREDSNLRPLGS